MLVNDTDYFKHLNERDEEEKLDKNKDSLEIKSKYLAPIDTSSHETMPKSVNNPLTPIYTPPENMFLNHISTPIIPHTPVLKVR